MSAPRWPSARRAHRTSGMDWIARTTRAAIYLRDGGACARCGAREGLSLDHLEGSRHTPTNLVTACARCNAARGPRPIDAFDPAYAARARALVRLPLDRAAGRALAWALWPARMRAQEQTAQRAHAKRQARRAAARLAAAALADEAAE